MSGLFYGDFERARRIDIASRYFELTRKFPLNQLGRRPLVSNEIAWLEGEINEAATERGYVNGDSDYADEPGIEREDRN